MSHKTVVFITTAVRTSNPTLMFKDSVNCNGFSLILKGFPHVDHVTTRTACLVAATVLCTVYCFNVGYDVMKILTPSLQQIQAFSLAMAVL
jgi:hypothetical protein